MKKPETTPSSWPLLQATAAVLTEKIERRLDEAQLPPLAWHDALSALERAPGQRLRMHELAEHLVLTRSNLSRLVERLAKAGLLRREADPDDRRGAFAVLTEQGGATRKKMAPHYGKAIAQFYDAQMSEDEQRVLNDALRKVLDAGRQPQ